MAYSYARLGGRDLWLFRLCGPGLGNLLFPWARFIVATRKYNLRPIAPAWPQFKWGTIRRGEKDKRFYSGLFRTPGDQITGLRRLSLLSRQPSVSETVLYKRPDKKGLDPSSIIVFQGLGGYFAPILKDHELVLDELLSITKDEHKSGMAYDFGGSISVHVRLTDFQPATNKPKLEPEASTRLPISWYQHIIREIRIAAGANMPVNIFSDGTDAELGPLLGMPSVRRRTFGSSIADLLAMSRSRVLITSGSTFSRWASYLGRMPVVWYPGVLGQRLYYDYPCAEIECGPADHMPRTFHDAIKF